MHELAYFNTHLRKHKYKILLAIVFITGTHIFSIAPAQIIKHTFDHIKHTYELQGANVWDNPIVLANHTELFKQIRWYIFLIIMMALLKSCCIFLMRQTILSTANVIEQELKNTIYDHYQDLPPSFYANRSTGQLLSLVIEDVNTVKLYLGPALLFILNSSILFIILIPYMVSVNLRLTLYSILPIVLLFIILYGVKDFIYRRGKELQTYLSSLITQSQETFTGIRTIQAFAREKLFIDHFSKTTQAYERTAIRLNTSHALPVPLSLAINSIGIILTIWVGGQEYIKGNLTFGNIAEFVTYMHLITWPIISIGLAAHYIQKANMAQKRINQFLNTKSTLKTGRNLSTPIKGSVRFESVSFTYPHTNVPTLTNITFTIPAGRSILVLGTTGSGKSTLTYLLNRLYEPSHGTITIDGIPIQDYDLPWLRNHIGYVPQDSWLLPDTIRHNITFGKKEATDAEIAQVIAQAGLTSTIQALPKQLDTVVGENGITLSGGQKQRLALARALIRNPLLLILDNPLSGVDNHTEKAIWKNLQTIIPGRTTLVISSNIIDPTLFDEVIVLQAGQIIEQGSPTNLLAAKKFYYKAYTQQT